jgi:hypothetical protein
MEAEVETQLMGLGVVVVEMVLVKPELLVMVVTVEMVVFGAFLLFQSMLDYLEVKEAAAVEAPSLVKTTLLEEQDRERVLL